MEYEQFAQLAELHRRLIGQVDQKVGAEKNVMRRYIAALDRRLTRTPGSAVFYERWRKESGMGTMRWNAVEALPYSCGKAFLVQDSYGSFRHFQCSLS